MDLLIGPGISPLAEGSSSERQDLAVKAAVRVQQCFAVNEDAIIVSLIQTKMAGAQLLGKSRVAHIRDEPNVIQIYFIGEHGRWSWTRHDDAGLRGGQEFATVGD